MVVICPPILDKYLDKDNNEEIMYMSCAWTMFVQNVTENVDGPQYYSQRGEDCPPRLDDSIFKYLDKDNNEEYAYIWSVNNEWK